ncbi:MAG TPA: hypothetical protein ENN60_02195 [archaeon]|nr:hypothetical protein [archaeon]
MDIKLLNKAPNQWEVELTSEDHTLANLLRELSWQFGGEAAYKLEHPLLGRPRLKVAARNPKKVLTEASAELVNLGRDFEKTFE